MQWTSPRAIVNLVQYGFSKRMEAVEMMKNYENKYDSENEIWYSHIKRTICTGGRLNRVIGGPNIS